ncbi:GGDEF domain-containing protein [Alishewanella longhuensis]|uniref:diguanylate cyclase n=1 Tax=Alishewanella longhuensis TaxID=1091037 RepID=A0ABQ3L136_9ALTE|nr:diguanylate cyclase [Alishewanella longhuensis]GHG69930.1 GGDEF domain-containing protein [Alishewanella longhuensis]
MLFSLTAHAIQIQGAKVELPDNLPVVVYDAAQDQQDYLWLAAEFDGLLRFDGQQYLRFVPPGPRRNLSYSQVVIDQKNQLWVGTWGNGVWRLDDLRENWQQVVALPESARIQSLLLSTSQILWIGTTEGLYQLAPGSMRAELWQPLAGQRIWYLAEQDNGTIWVATSNGLYQLTSNTATASGWLPHEQFHSKEIRAVAVQGQQLLVGLQSHLYLLDLTQPEQLTQLTFGNPNTLLVESANSWLAGSIDGMFRVRLTQLGLQTELLLSAIDVRRLFRDRLGQIWLSSRNNGFLPLAPAPLRAIEPDLSKFLSPKKPHRLGPNSVTLSRWQALDKTLLQLKDGKWRELSFQAEPSVAYVRDVVEFGPYTLAATDQGLFRLYNDSYFVPVALNIKLNRFNIERLAIAADGALWLGLWQEGVIRIAAEAATQDIASWQAVQLQPELPTQDGIIDIQTDAQQRLWLLSRQGKLYQGESDKITLRWQPDNALLSGYFQCMLPDEDSLWLCSDRGLIRLSEDLTATTIWGQAEGLPDQRVIGITRTEKLIWVLTRHGVLNFKPDGSHLHLLRHRPGLDLSGVQLKGISTLVDDQIQLATSTGIWQLSQADMSAVPTAMQLHLASMRLNQQLFSVGERNRILLPKRLAELQLQFKLLTLQPHLRVQYFFRWQHQQEWTALGHDAILTLSQLNPGEHQLEVMAKAGGQTVLSKPLSLLVPIPFWQQPIGMTLLIFLSIIVLWVLYRLRIRHLEQRAQALDLIVAQRTAELELANQQLQVQSNTDSLTGLLNRRALYAAAAALQAQRNRTPMALTLVLIDIDHFKKINDVYGHDVGDTVLKTFAAYLKQRLRRQDLLARWGGEEFLLLMPQTDVQPASKLMAELRLGIKQLQIAELDMPLTATFGISAVSLHHDALDMAVKAADLALYRGKAQGRDQIVLAADSLDTNR